MREYRPNNIPLPRLPLPRKLLFTAVLLSGLALFSASWATILSQIYHDGVAVELGVALGILAGMDRAAYNTLFALHAAGMGLLFAGSYTLFRMTSIRRRVKSLLIYATVALALIDLYGWYRAPSCSSSNLIVGILGIIAGVPLAALGSAPLIQLWWYRRWRSPDGAPKRVVIVGGGFAGLYAALGLNRVLGYHPDLELSLIDRKNYFLFPPLLPSAAAGTIEERQVSYPFRRIFETTNVVFRKAEVTAIDPAARTITALVEQTVAPESGAPLLSEASFPYDFLVLAPGSVTQTFGTAGVEQHAFFMRELQDAVRLRNQVIDCFERAAVVSDAEERRELLRFVIVGAGPTGIETATEIYDLIHQILLKRYPEIAPELPEVLIVQSGKQILPGWPDDIVRTAERQLAHMRIRVLLGDRVTAVTPRSVSVGTESPVPARTIVWCAGVTPSPLLARTGLELHPSGRIAVTDELRVAAAPEIFVLGDAAHLIDTKSNQVLPPLGQVAFQQGSRTASNLARLLGGKPARPFRYFNFGGLVSIGEHFAAVNLMGVRFSGFVGWVIWRSLYLAKLVGMSNRIRVLVDWTLDLFIERSIAQIGDSDRGTAAAARRPPWIAESPAAATGARAELSH